MSHYVPTANQPRVTEDLGPVTLPCVSVSQFDEDEALRLAWPELLVWATERQGAIVWRTAEKLPRRGPLTGHVWICLGPNGQPQTRRVKYDTSD